MVACVCGDRGRVESVSVRSDCGGSDLDETH